MVSGSGPSVVLQGIAKGLKRDRAFFKVALRVVKTIEKF